MEIVFLGTSCMAPTKERNHQSIFISHEGEGILIDCGEGTQRQLKIADIRLTKITKIFITHWHGDHVLGLPGLLQTMNSSEYEGSLDIYGPKGTASFFKHMFKAFSFNIGFNYNITEIKKDNYFELKNFVVFASFLEHNIPCLGYSFVEKEKRKIKLSVTRKHGIPDGPLLGKLQSNEDITWNNKKITANEATYLTKGRKITVILDTLACKQAYELAKDSDLLICEASYDSDLENKAEEYKHMTARQAAQLASQSNVKKLVLTHFSQRYTTTEKLFDDARLIFQNTIMAYDFMKLKI